MKDILIALLEGEVLIALVYAALAAMLVWAVIAPDGLAFLIGQLVAGR